MIIWDLCAMVLDFLATSLGIRFLQNGPVLDKKLSFATLT